MRSRIRCATDSASAAAVCRAGFAPRGWSRLETSVSGGGASAGTANLPYQKTPESFRFRTGDHRGRISAPRPSSALMTARQSEAEPSRRYEIVRTVVFTREPFGQVRRCSACPLLTLGGFISATSGTPRATMSPSPPASPRSPHSAPHKLG